MPSAMRKVAIKKYKQTHPTPAGCVWAEDGEETGWFHKWATDFEELQGGVGMHPVAIVEMPDGTIRKMMPEQVRFLSQPEEAEDGR